MVDMILIMKTIALLLILSSCQLVEAPLVYCHSGQYAVTIDGKKIPNYAVNGVKNTGADVTLEAHSFTDDEIVFSLNIDNQPGVLKVNTKRNELGSYVGKINFKDNEQDISCSLQNLR